MSALAGITVLDLTRLLPGTAAAKRLAEAGAEILKVEQPGFADPTRSMLRGIESIALDLKSEADRDTLRDLAKRADALLESFRPGVMDRLGLGYDALAALNPRLIYCSITGYGQTGPYRDVAGHDINYIAMAGLLDLTGTADGPPVIPGTQIADLAGGAMQAVIGILLALEERRGTGRGRRVDVSMTDGVKELMPLATPGRGTGMLTGGLACYNVYRAADGRHVSVGALEPKFWANLCAALGCEDLIGDQYAPADRQGEMKRVLSACFARRTATDWWEALGRQDCCVTPVLSVGETLSRAESAGLPE